MFLRLLRDARVRDCLGCEIISKCPPPYYYDLLIVEDTGVLESVSPEDFVGEVGGSDLKKQTKNHPRLHKPILEKGKGNTSESSYFLADSVLSI